MRIGNFYFDEKDILLIFSLGVLILLKFFNIALFQFISLEKTFMIIFLSFIARIFMGKGKENIIFVILIISLVLSGSLSFPGLLAFLLLAFLISSFVFKNY